MCQYLSLHAQVLADARYRTWNLLSTQVCKSTTATRFVPVAHDVCKLAEACKNLGRTDCNNFRTDEEREIDPYDTTPNEASTEFLNLIVKERRTMR